MNRERSLRTVIVHRLRSFQGNASEVADKLSVAKRRNELHVPPRTPWLCVELGEQVRAG